VRGLIASPDYRTRYAVYLVIIVFPAVLYWAVDYTAGPSSWTGWTGNGGLGGTPASFRGSRPPRSGALEG